MNAYQLTSRPPSLLSHKDYQDYIIEQLERGELYLEPLRAHAEHYRGLRRAMLDKAFQTRFYAQLSLCAMDFASEIATGRMYDDCVDKVTGEPHKVKIMIKDNIINHQKWLFGKIEKRMNTSTNQNIIMDEPRRIMAINVPQKKDEEDNVKTDV